MRWLIPFIATLFSMMALQMSSLGFSPLLPAIQKEFALNFSQVGLFTGLYGILAILLSYPAGVLAKRFGEKKVLTTGLLIVSAGLLCLSVAPSFVVALASRILWLTGYRMAFVCVMTAMVLTAPPRLRGSAMGILGAASSIATLIGAPFGSKLGETFGWRHGMIGFGIMAFAGATIFALFYKASSDRNSVRSPHQIGSAAPGGTPAHRVPAVWALAVLLGCCNAGGFSSTFFVPAALKGDYGMDAVSASYVISASYLFAVVANLLSGYLMDRFDRWKIMKALLSVIVIASLCMTVHNPIVFRISVAIIIGLGLVCANQVYGMGGDVLRGRETGPVMGIVSLGAGVFGYMGPQLLGSLRDWTGGFHAGWCAMAGLASIALAVVFGLSRSLRSVKTLAAHDV